MGAIRRYGDTGGINPPQTPGPTCSGDVYAGALRGLVAELAVELAGNLAAELLEREAQPPEHGAAVGAGRDLAVGELGAAQHADILVAACRARAFDGEAPRGRHRAARALVPAGARWEQPAASGTPAAAQLVPAQPGSVCAGRGRSVKLAGARGGFHVKHQA